MYDCDLVRKLCGAIREEKDPQKAEELLSLMRSVLSGEFEEARTGTTFLWQTSHSGTNSTAGRLSSLQVFHCWFTRLLF
jgi:hypothetical protein